MKKDINIINIALICSVMIAIYFIFKIDVFIVMFTVVTICFFEAVVIDINNLERRLSDVEKTIYELVTLTDEIEVGRRLSHRIDIEITIGWIEIIKKCLPGLKRNENVLEFVNNLYKDSELKANREEGVFGKSFSLVQFHDGLSGLEQIWLDKYKVFLDKLEIRGYLFGWSLELSDRFRDSIGRPFCISPGYIGFGGYDHPLWTDKISQIPYYDILHFLIEIAKNIDDFRAPMLAIKKFPHDLEEQFKEYNVVYEHWNMWDLPGSRHSKLASKWAEANNVKILDLSTDDHTFKTPYYSVSIKMKMFH